MRGLAMTIVLALLGTVLMLSAAPSTAAPAASRSVTLNVGVGLNDVAVRNRGDTWAVGYRVRPSGAIRTRTMHQDGAGWTTIPSPNQPTRTNVLNAVDVRSEDDAWAVGYFGSPDGARTLILHWDGATWTRIPSPNPGAFYRYLNDVNVVSKNDVWAVGQYYTAAGGWQQHTMTLHWDGNRWSWIESPDPKPYGHNTLYGVSSIGSDDAWAVGSNGLGNTGGAPREPLLLHWNGTRWTRRNPLPDSQITLYAVSAVTTDDAWAVGNVGYGYDENVILHWDGDAWTQVASPAAGFQHNLLGSITAVSSTDVWAAGTSDGQAAFFRWDGDAWMRVVQDPVIFANVNAVSARSPDHALAVGFRIDADTSRQIPVALRWDGAAWSKE